VQDQSADKRAGNRCVIRDMITELLACTGLTLKISTSPPVSDGQSLAERPAYANHRYYINLNLGCRMRLVGRRKEADRELMLKMARYTSASA
jgi:hypothetical protein